MEYIAFVIYLLLFAWLVTRIRFFTNSGLSKPQLVILFLLKVIAGIFYGWMGVYYSGTAQMVDTWNYHFQSIQEYELLWSNPSEYFSNLFHNAYPEGFNNFLASSNSYWNDLKSNIFIKFLSVINIFSFGYYYVNVLFYSFICLFGPVAFYRVMKEIFPGQKFLLAVSVFLVPSFFYWASGIHKEGLLFLGLSLVVYHFYYGYREHRFPLKRILGILTGLLILSLLRNFLLVLIIPPLIAWWIANPRPQRLIAVFSGVYVLFCILFFTLKLVDPRLDFPQSVVEKQQAFIALKGKSSVPIRELSPDVRSFLVNTPQAFTLSALRPYPSDIRHLPSLVAAIETGLIWLLFLLFLCFHKRRQGLPAPVIHFGIFFSVSLLLTIGFSVNNLGAIVRYRSIILPFLLVPVVLQTDWNRIFALFLTSSKKDNGTSGRQ